MKLIILLICTLSINLCHSANKPKGVNWHQGSVQEAIVQAKKQSRPLFLYWGAVWCPPCNQIKKTIFTKKEFHRESRHFINVYLDGDTPMAQKWGTHFGTVGYPTMMILNTSGDEVTRMPTGLNVTQYVQLMEKIRKNLLPIDQLVKKALSGKASVEDYQKLAGYSWGQDFKMRKTFLSKENKFTTFKELYQKAPKNHPYINTHFFLRYHLEKVKNNESSPSKKEDAIDFSNILKSKESLQGNIELLTYHSKEFKKSFSKHLGDKEFKKEYLKLMKSIRNDESRSLDERLSTLFVLIELNRKKNKDLPSHVVNSINYWTKKVEQEATGSLERQATLSTAVWLLKISGQISKAKQLATRELEKSTSPYYLMRYLGKMEIDSGHQDKGLNWYKKAWLASKGHATSFEWGSSYLINLLKLTPKNHDEIFKTSHKIFSELLTDKGAFYGRNSRRLDRIKKSFSKWKGLYPSKFNKVLADIKNLCSINQIKSIKKHCLHWTNNL